MYRIAVCDDDCVIREKIVDYAREFFSKQNTEAAIKSFSDGAEIIPLYNDGSKPFDILLLDGEMKNVDGYELSLAIRKYDSAVMIIFVSGWERYAVKGYEVGVHRFVRKRPEQLKDELFTALTSAVKEFEMGRKRFPIKCGHDTRWYITSDVSVIEALNRQLIIHLEDSSETICGKLSDLVRLLVPYGFVQCHRSYIVNISKINLLKADWIYMSNGKEIPLGRSFKQLVNDAFTRYLGGVM